MPPSRKRSIKSSSPPFSKEIVKKPKQSSSKKTVKNEDLSPNVSSITDEYVDEYPDVEQKVLDDVENDQFLQQEEEEEAALQKGKFFVRKILNKRKKKEKITELNSWEDNTLFRFLGEAISVDEACRRWPFRYEKKDGKEEEEEVMIARRHFSQALVHGCVYNLYDHVHVQGEGDTLYIARIVEFFEATDNKAYFTAQWFYKPADTVIELKVISKDLQNVFDKRRVFYSDDTDENLLECLIQKINIVQVAPSIGLSDEQCDYFCDMHYSSSFSTFSNLPPDFLTSPQVQIGVSSKSSNGCGSAPVQKNNQSSMNLLDLYAGCGAMSTGLCLGAAKSGLKLITRWAVDYNQYACSSLKLNHPDTEVRNESAEDFLALLQAWQQLCGQFSLLGTPRSAAENVESTDFEEGDDEEVPEGEFEVEKFIGICFGDPRKAEEPGLHYKVRWKGYSSDYDSWEPAANFGTCEGKVKEFVTHGYHSYLLPLPGDVDVLCGGPPCQGISGFNRFRDKENPLKDLKNKQLIIFMNTVDFLKPRFILMENVLDILKFAGGYLGRYTLGRLVGMNYQVRLGVMAAGSYGLPQFRLRAFFWGACCNEMLPPFPLPTHEAVVRNFVPIEFEGNTVAPDEDDPCNLKEALVLEDVLSDLPPVENDETLDEMPYTKAAQTAFQKQIRLPKHESGNMTPGKRPSQNGSLYDHRPLKLNEDDYLRVCRIPHKKGANFRDLPGLVFDEKNKVALDPTVKRELLPSRKPLVPDYAIKFVRGISRKPFGRVWFDETIATVVTRAEPHNQAVLHPLEDRVLTIRENARIQGFPDYYRLSGPVKQRYMQVGNAVAVPVACALGYALGEACKGTLDDRPIVALPKNFPN